MAFPDIHAISSLTNQREVATVAIDNATDRLKLGRAMIAGLNHYHAARLSRMTKCDLIDIEKNRREITAKELEKLAETYDVNVDWLSGKSPVALDEGDPRLADVRFQLAFLTPADQILFLTIRAATLGPVTQSTEA
jgi:transcriptional regulator with XRE-family HTH domain